MRDDMHLHRVDPDRNMARFYLMSVQPNLFGEWALVREWGRIGSAGRLVSVLFVSEQEAAQAMAQHTDAKLRRGYEVVQAIPRHMGAFGSEGHAPSRFSKRLKPAPRPTPVMCRVSSACPQD